MRRAFRQEEYAVKYAIEPLLNQSGPLGQLEVRLKLIFALGLISLERYQDIEAYIKIRDFLVRDPKDYRFSDKPIRDLLDRLHGVNQGGMMKLEPPPAKRIGLSTRCSSTGSIRWCAPHWYWRWPTVSASSTRRAPSNPAPRPPHHHGWRLAGALHTTASHHDADCRTSPHPGHDARSFRCQSDQLSHYTSSILTA